MFFPKPNQVTKETPDFYISFNCVDVFIYGGSTTAIVIGQMQRFYILTGDHRDAYNKCATFQDCIKYFLDNQDKINKMSDTYDLHDALEVQTEYAEFLRRGQ